MFAHAVATCNIQALNWRRGRPARANRPTGALTNAVGGALSANKAGLRSLRALL